ncbi:molybdenum ABC transporter ATP-binding protein [Aurantivibrio infirmus]
MSSDNIKLKFYLSYSDFSLNVDFEIPGQGVTAIFGHSGSGKTSLLRCIAGLEEKVKGRLHLADQCWQDENLFLPAHKRPIAYVFQEASLFSHLSVLGNLRFALKRADKQSSLISLDDVISLLGIDHLLTRSTDKLSGGERQRVAIARALLINPRLLLLDEPLAALDNASKNEIFPYLEKLRSDFDVPMLYVSHSPDEVARLADHIVVLDRGKVVASGGLQDTLARLDFPIQLGDDRGVVIDAEVVEKDEQWSLVKVDFDGGELWLRDANFSLQQNLRLHIHAKDISLTLDRHQDSSILNILPGTVTEILIDKEHGNALVKLEVGNTFFLSRLTLRSVAHLDLVSGKNVWLQIKSVALIQ